MDTTDKEVCNILVDLLCRHNVTEAVVSPGSRNAPILVALAACDIIKKTVVIDERSAAFIALGKAALSDTPVALVCTSGTAVLNYSPAVAEAYYRMLPLIVISADRPMEWIDQDDSQTLRQYEALSHYVKRSYNLPSFSTENNILWYSNRVINDALICATNGRKAPVHINVQLDEPLNGTRKPGSSKWIDRVIDNMPVDKTLSPELADRIVAAMSLSKVMIIGGFHTLDKRLDESLRLLAKKSNIVVLTEKMANVSSPDYIDCIDATLSVMPDEDRDAYVPDIVITFGGALVSRMVKAFLRQNDVREHWHVGESENTIDCFQSLTSTVNMPAVDFFSAVSAAYSHEASGSSGYRSLWRALSEKGQALHRFYIDSSPWSDLKAMEYVFENLPDGCNVQLSNGTSVRYAQLFKVPSSVRFDSNRGVSGIDGTTSTAIGASTVTDRLTILITGDMSVQYDLSAFSAPGIGGNFKMIVLCNGGGGIFRFIKSTSSLPQLEEYFVVDRHFPLKSIAEAYGFDYCECSSEEELREIYPRFLSRRDAPSVMSIVTDGELSAKVLRDYFSKKLNLLGK